MGQKIYQVDAFTSRLFGGNPAAVCIQDHWLSDKTMQQIASENRLSETAFCVLENGKYTIRWFTPEIEVELCGHATLATAHVLFEHLGYSKRVIEFHSPHSGALMVEKTDEGLVLDFPADTVEEIRIPYDVVKTLHASPVKAYKGKTDFMFVFAGRSEVERMKPDFKLLAEMGGRGVIVTAPGVDVDFVSRFFAPQTGINEDPVTGSAHTTLTPYWSATLGRKKLKALQVSARGGELICEDLGERIKIAGRAVTYMVGELFI
ncbi:MAG: PhzF family phenazine biosynthesis protein [Bacteroidales bacterium]